MTESTDKSKPPGDEPGGDITDFLQAPRKKRKNYVIMALGKQFDTDLYIAMDGYVKKNILFINLLILLNILFLYFIDVDEVIASRLSASLNS